MRDPHFFKYDNWFYPVGSISFRINSDGTVSMFHLSEDHGVGLFKGKDAEVMVKMLSIESLDLDGIGEMHNG